VSIGRKTFNFNVLSKKPSLCCLLIKQYGYFTIFLMKIKQKIGPAPINFIAAMQEPCRNVLRD
jgi:hypothetical protein